MRAGADGSRVCDDRAWTLFDSGAGGFLSGKYTRDKPKGESGDRLGGFDFLPYDRARGFELVDLLRAIAAKRDATPAQVALAWVLTRPAVASVLIGASRADQLEDNLGAADLLRQGELGDGDALVQRAARGRWRQPGCRQPLRRHHRGDDQRLLPAERLRLEHDGRVLPDVRGRSA